MGLKSYRESKKLSQREMAEELEVSRDVYISWESGRSIPRPENMQKIVEITNGEVQPNDFYKGE